jgi:hypothetical protein
MGSLEDSTRVSNTTLPADQGWLIKYDRDGNLCRGRKKEGMRVNASLSSGR